MNLIAVTACPTGIAHSQMAAENLENTAEELGHAIKVEVEGAMGTENELTSDDVAGADAVIIAADTTVQRDRFEGLPVIKGTVKDAVNDPEDLVRQAVDAAAERGGGEAAADASAAEESDATADDDSATEATTGDDSATEATTGDEPATEATGSHAAGGDDSTDATTDAGERSRDDRERQGIVGKLKSLFS